MFGIGKIDTFRKGVSRIDMPGYDISLSSPISAEDVVEIRNAIYKSMAEHPVIVRLSGSNIMTINFIPT